MHENNILNNVEQKSEYRWKNKNIQILQWLLPFFRHKKNPRRIEHLKNQESIYPDPAFSKKSEDTKLIWGLNLTLVYPSLK